MIFPFRAAAPLRQADTRALLVAWARAQHVALPMTNDSRVGRGLGGAHSSAGSAWRKCRSPRALHLDETHLCAQKTAPPCTPSPSKCRIPRLFRKKRYVEIFKPRYPTFSRGLNERSSSPLVTPRDPRASLPPSGLTSDATHPSLPPLAQVDLSTRWTCSPMPPSPH